MLLRPDKALCRAPALALCFLLASCGSSETPQAAPAEERSDRNVVVPQAGQVGAAAAPARSEADARTSPAVAPNATAAPDDAATKAPAKAEIAPRPAAEVVITTAGPASPPPSFAICSACHTVAKGAAAKLGPNLFGVAGERAAGQAGFAYSEALRNASVVWTDAELDAYLESPQKLVPGTRMTFRGVADPAQRAQIIAYMKTLK